MLDIIHFYISNQIINTDDKFNTFVRISFLENVRYKIYTILFNFIDRNFKIDY